jgi:hypothetical protein
MRNYAVILTLAFFFGLTGNSFAATAIVDSVPAYEWYHGCGPTAAASVLGYWDLNGYDNLFGASGWDDVRLTANVRDEISSPAHNTMYNPDPDLPGPAPPDTSIADFFHTSEGLLPYGASYLSNAVNAFEGYADYRGYDFDALTVGWGTFTWMDIITEIDGGYPMAFAVDTVGDGFTDHFVPVLGYDDRGIEGLYYGFYTTWSEEESIVWREFQEMGNQWGVGYATFVHPHSTLNTPIPSTVFLFGTGLIALLGIKRKIRK